MVEVRSSPRKTAPAQRVLSQRGSFSSKIYRSPCTEAAWGAGGGRRGERDHLGVLVGGRVQGGAVLLLDVEPGPEAVSF